MRIRIPDDLKPFLDEQATKRDITVSQYVVSLITRERVRDHKLAQTVRGAR
jgi:hypothetical protein